MTIKRLLAAATLAGATAFAVAVAPAQADDCDDILDAIKKLNERIMNAKDDAKSPLAVCWAVGQVVGVMKAAREMAAECYDEGAKRTDILATFDKTTKEMEGQFDGICK
jgi:hypothetical protein